MRCELAAAWQKRRSEFNHDWLKNRYIPALAKWLNLLDDLIEDAPAEAGFVASVLPQWEGRSQEGLALAHDFVTAMSPAGLLDCIECLRRRTDKEWLRQLIHQLWLARYPIHEWIADASDC